MTTRATNGCRFRTERTAVAPWGEFDGDLAVAVSKILTAKTTVALPESWQGEYTPERAHEWIKERDAESPTLMVTWSDTGELVGLIVLAEIAESGCALDLRLGYLIDESAWGTGLGTEIVSGLISWATSEPTIRTVTGGVASDNKASVRVLEKCGFEPLANEGEPETVMYRRSLR